MSIVSAIAPAVHIPTDSDGYLRPDLIPVAAYLCSEEYTDRARSRVINRLADGLTPRQCCQDGALEWRDLLDVEALMPAARLAIAPIRGGSPALDGVNMAAVLAGPSDDFEPAFLSIAEWREREEIAEALAAYDAGEIGEDLADDGQAPDDTLSFPGWIEAQAESVRALGTDAAEWLAGQIASLADRARFLNASTPAEYDDRADVLDSAL